MRLSTAIGTACVLVAAPVRAQTLTWTASQTPTVTGYAIEYFNSATGAAYVYGQVNVGLVTTASIPAAVLADPTGSFWVIDVYAYDASGQTSDPSNAVVWPAGGPPPPPPPPALTLTCPAPITTPATDGTSAAVVFSDPTPTGGVTPYTTSCAQVSGSTFSVGTTQVACSAQDAAGNTAACAFTVTVTPPPLSVVCAGDVSVSALDGNPVPVLFPLPTTTGGLPPITASCQPSSGSLFPVGDTAVACTAQDAWAPTQVAFCSLTVHVTVPQTAPPAPTSPSPANGSTVNGRGSVTLAWGGCAGCVYDVYFGTGSAPPLRASGGTGTSVTVGKLQAGVTYTWRVVARTSAGSTSSALWSFKQR